MPFPEDLFYRRSDSLQISFGDKRAELASAYTPVGFLNPIDRVFVRGCSLLVLIDAMDKGLRMPFSIPELA
jgi:hypothetical protein